MIVLVDRGFQEGLEGTYINGNTKNLGAFLTVEYKYKAGKSYQKQFQSTTEMCLFLKYGYNGSQEYQEFS